MEPLKMEPLKTESMKMESSKMDSYIADYISDEESSNANDNDEPQSSRKRKRKDLIDWVKEKTFTDNDSFLNFLKQEDTWSYQAQFVDSDGNIIVRYRCNKVKFRGPQCSATIRSIYKSSTDEICVYRSSAKHNHADIISKSGPRLRGHVKQQIQEIFAEDNHIRAKKVLDILTEKNIPLPTYRQVANFLNKLRTTEYGPTIISLGQLETLLTENSKIPEDDDTAFVVDYEISYDEPSYFRFFMSSKTLMKNALKTEHLHADGTNKLLWQGFPMLVVGTSDRYRAFHCCGMAVCSNDTTNDFAFIFQALQKGIQNICDENNYNPKVLIADTTESVRNGFQQVFGNDTLIIMCWTHTHKSITKKLQELVPDKKIRQEVISDVECLQLSKNAIVFLNALNLFITKWEIALPEFINYFKENWVDQNSNWYEAACNFVPSNNNSLESFNKVIRDEHIIRQRLPLPKFLMTTLNYLTKYSSKYSEDMTFHDAPNISLEIWSKAYKWAKANKKITINTLESSEYQHYKIPGRHLTDIKNSREFFNTFDEFKEVNFECYNVLLLANNTDLKGECDCAQFLQFFMCKHVVGLGIRLKIVVPPPEAKYVPVEKKGTKGRPSKKKKAFLQL